MRLLDSTTLELRDFPNHEGVPYAILSHTWAEGEVLFPDIDGFNTKTMPKQIKEKLGFKKIEACCTQARQDGFGYVWIDTCCIDKRSSAELSEAINSMYRWYQDCIVCYAYLADVPNNASLEVQELKFRESRWFTRGWTLQELIGPLTLEFYGDQWHTIGQSAALGTKRSLQSEISQITKIPEDALLSSSFTQADYCIAQRMSWAAGRSTERIEDRAYCLLGLFNVNMPLLYGEGLQAFVRLQEEIMKISTDESLFAWTVEATGYHGKNGRGLLAISADEFSESGQIMEKIHSLRKVPSVVTNRGLHLEATLLDGSEAFSQMKSRIWPYKIENAYIAVLNCVDIRSGKLIGMLLAHSGNNQEDGEFIRLDPTKLELIDPLDQKLQDKICMAIYARVSGVRGLRAAVLDVADRHYHLERQHKILVVKEIPLAFRVVKQTPEELWTNWENALWMAKLETEVGERETSYEISFDDGTGSFTILFTFYLGLPRMQVLPGVGTALTERLTIVTSRQNRSCDRATCMLSSQRVVSASLRPERWSGTPCYVLHISANVAS